MTKLFSLLLLSFLCGIGSLSAQLVVYKLQFEKVGDTVNFRAFDTAFYVAPATGGKGTLLIGTFNNGTKGQATLDSAGDFFMARQSDKNRAVLTANTSNDAANISMLLLGEPKTLLVTQPSEAVIVRVRVPELMSGTMLVADTAADTGAVTDLNATAGVAKVKARLDIDLSKSLTKNGTSLAVAVTQLQARLTNQGYAAAETGTGTGTTTGTAAGN